MEIVWYFNILLAQLFSKLLTDFTFNSKVSYLREHNSKWLKTGATIVQNIDFEISVVQLMEINTCNSL